MSLVIPNNFPGLTLLERVPPERPDRMSTDTKYVILAWLPSDKGNKLIPITLCGIPPMRTDAAYAIVSAEDKSYSTLDGVRFANYADWLRACERGQKPAETAAVRVAPSPPADPTRQPPQAWHTPEKAGRT